MSLTGTSRDAPTITASASQPNPAANHNQNHGRDNNVAQPKNRRKTMQHLGSAARPAHLSSARWMSPARWARRSAAVLITLAAPAISISGALTTGLNGTSPAVHFPPGFWVSLTATVAATTLAAVLAAVIARRDALIAIPVSLGIWLITGLSVITAAVQLDHTRLALWGVILVAASLIGAAAGMLLAARRGRAGQPPSPRIPAVSQPLRTLPARETLSWQADTDRKENQMPRT